MTTPELTASGGFSEEGVEATPHHVAMTWAQRLKRVFLIDVTVCEHCGGAVKIIARIEDAHRSKNSRPCGMTCGRGRRTAPDSMIFSTGMGSAIF